MTEDDGWGDEEVVTPKVGGGIYGALLAGIGNPDFVRFLSPTWEYVDSLLEEKTKLSIENEMLSYRARAFDALLAEMDKGRSKKLWGRLSAEHKEKEDPLCTFARILAKEINKLEAGRKDGSKKVKDRAARRREIVQGIATDMRVQGREVNDRTVHNEVKRKHKDGNAAVIEWFSSANKKFDQTTVRSISTYLSAGVAKKLQ